METFDSVRSVQLEGKKRMRFLVNEYLRHLVVIEDIVYDVTPIKDFYDKLCICDQSFKESKPKLSKRLKQQFDMFKVGQVKQASQDEMKYSIVVKRPEQSITPQNEQAQHGSMKFLSIPPVASSRTSRNSKSVKLPAQFDQAQALTVSSLKELLHELVNDEKRKESYEKWAKYRQERQNELNSLKLIQFDKPDQFEGQDLDIESPPVPNLVIPKSYEKILISQLPINQVQRTSSQTKRPPE